MPIGPLRLLLMAAAAAAPAAEAGEDPLTQPPPDGLALVWLQPSVPKRLHGDAWLVGSAVLSVVAIDSGAGLVLIDGGPAHMAPLVERNLAAVGLSIKDVRLILSSEPHYDHAGALRALVRDSGARVIASPAGAAVLKAGRSGPGDPQAGVGFVFPRLRRVQAVADGETVRLGHLVMTGWAMPGHTPGSMAWSWRSCAGGRCANMVFAASLSPRTDGRFRWSDPRQAAALAAFRHSIARLRALPCDILVTPHPLGPDPVEVVRPDEDACDRLASRAERDLARQLDAERSPTFAQ